MKKRIIIRVVFRPFSAGTFSPVLFVFDINSSNLNVYRGPVLGVGWGKQASHRMRFITPLDENRVLVPYQQKDWGEDPFIVDLTTGTWEEQSSGRGMGSDGNSFDVAYDGSFLYEARDVLDLLTPWPYMTDLSVVKYSVSPGLSSIDVQRNIPPGLLTFIYPDIALTNDGRVYFVYRKDAGKTELWFTGVTRYDF